jgi:hypothetical protein
VTEKGLLGLGPEIIEAGDVICILFGASLPAVLRKISSEGSSYWKIVGWAQIGQLMHGEAMEMWRKEEVEEVWFEIH